MHKFVITTREKRHQSEMSECELKCTKLMRKNGPKFYSGLKLMNNLQLGFNFVNRSKHEQK